MLFKRTKESKGVFDAHCSHRILKCLGDSSGEPGRLVLWGPMPFPEGSFDHGRCMQLTGSFAATWMEDGVCVRGSA